jgi:hypothetical protein
MMFGLAAETPKKRKKKGKKTWNEENKSYGICTKLDLHAVLVFLK